MSLAQIIYVGIVRGTFALVFWLLVAEMFVEWIGG